MEKADDGARGVPVIRSNAEARFATRVFSGPRANNSEPLLGLWMNDVLAALNESKEAKREITETKDLDKVIDGPGSKSLSC